MKKAILISLLIVSVLAIGICVFLNKKTSPESRLKQQFNIDITSRNYSIVDSKEEWLANGDGFFYAEITLGRSENIIKDLTNNDFKPVPIVEEVPKNQFVNIGDVKNGYYKFGFLDSDTRNFKIAIYD